MLLRRLDAAARPAQDCSGGAMFRVSTTGIRGAAPDAAWGAPGGGVVRSRHTGPVVGRWAGARGEELGSSVCPRAAAAGRVHAVDCDGISPRFYLVRVLERRAESRSRDRKAPQSAVE